MPLAYKQLAQTQIGTSAATLYTTPAATQTIIKSIRIVNTDSSPRWVKLWNNAGAAGTTDADLILPQTSIPAGGWAELDSTLTMAAADTLSAQAEVASKVTITVHGAEVT